MLLYNFFLKVPLIIGGILVFVGLLLKFFPPKKVNWFYGYRTPQSMASEKAWHYAQKYSAREALRWGFMCVAISFLGVALRENEDAANLVSLFAVIAAIALLMIRTEMELKRRFGKKN